MRKSEKEKILQLIGPCAIEKIQFMDAFQRNPSIELRNLVITHLVSDVHEQTKNYIYYTDKIISKLLKNMDKEEGFFSQDFVVVKTYTIKRDKIYGIEYFFEPRIIKKGKKVEYLKEKSSAFQEMGQIIEKYKGYNIIFSSEDVCDEEKNKSSGLYDNIGFVENISIHPKILVNKSNSKGGFGSVSGLMPQGDNNSSRFHHWICYSNKLKYDPLFWKPK